MLSDDNEYMLHALEGKLAPSPGTMRLDQSRLPQEPLHNPGLYTDSDGVRIRRTLLLLSQVAFKKAEEVLDGKLAIEEFIRQVKEAGKREGWELSAVAYWVIADLYDRLGRLPESIPYLEQAIQGDPTNFRVLNNLGTALTKIGRFKEALDYLKRAINFRPADAQILTNLGVAYRELGKFPEAIQSFDAAIDAEPSYAFAWLNKGILHDIEGKDELAVEMFRKGLALPREPFEFKPHLYGDAYLLLCQSFLKLKRNEEALEAARKAISEGGERPVATLYIVNCLLVMGNLEEARIALSEISLNDLPKVESVQKGYADLVQELKAAELEDENQLEETLKDLDTRYGKTFRKLAE